MTGRPARMIPRPFGHHPALARVFRAASGASAQGGLMVREADEAQ